MDRFCIVFAILLSSSVSLSSLTVEKGECNETDSGTKLKMTLIENASGGWISSFYAEKSLGELTKLVTVDMEYNISSCGSGRILRIRGVLRDAADVSSANKTMYEMVEQLSSSRISNWKKRNDEVDVLRFSKKKGRNAALMNDGRTAYRTDPWNQTYSASVIMNRPLKNEELFEVMIDRAIDKWKENSIVIGVTVSPPENIESLIETYHHKKDKWCLVFNVVYSNDEVVQKYHPINLNKLKVVDRVGVKVRSNGNLHFYLNGKDWGPTATNVPMSVYGLIDVIQYVEQISLVG